MDFVSLFIEIKWLSPANRKRTRFPRLFIANIEQLAPIKSLKNEDFLRQKYLEEGLSLQEITAETVSSWKTVRRHLMFSNIPIRKSDLRFKPIQRFGMAVVDGEIAISQMEQQALKRLKSLRSSGLSYRKIVETINQEKVPCRKSGGRWHIKTVFEFINRE